MKIKLEKYLSKNSTFISETLYPEVDLLEGYSIQNFILKFRVITNPYTKIRLIFHYTNCKSCYN